MNRVILAQGVSKGYGATLALDGVNLEIGEGRIVGLIGPNGAGKSSLLRSILGLSPCQGRLEVLGRNPARHRARLMTEASFIADVSSLPGWMTVKQLMVLMNGAHPAFREAVARDLLGRTGIDMKQKVRSLSRGMKIQLHLALVMGIDARLLVLDEPTLGLDLLYRRKFYAQLLEEYFDGSRTVVLATHEVGEVEPLLTDVIFLHRGRVVLDVAMDAIPDTFVALQVDRSNLEVARSLGPFHEEAEFNRWRLYYRSPPDGVRARLMELGQVSTPSLADLFVACLAGDGREEEK